MLLKRKYPSNKEGKKIVPPAIITPHLQAKRVNDSGIPRDISLIQQIREYELITPLFGGGTQTQLADPVSVIRVPSIRGHLRFWWRACRAAKYPSISQMKKVEDSIWGSTESPSAVVIQLYVDEKDRGQAVPAYSVAWSAVRGKFETEVSPKIHPYAAFPLQPDKEEAKKDKWESEPVVVGLRFRLTLRFPNQIQIPEIEEGERRLRIVPGVEKEINAALWAWETFGGLGARTRRGFGALRLIKKTDEISHDWPTDAKEVEADLRKKLKEHVLSGKNHTCVPQLTHDVPIKLTSVTSVSTGSDKRSNIRNNALEAWKSLIDQLSSFRQARYGGRMGISKWPEANEIRRRAGLPLRVADEAEDKPLVQKFPRAVFGLPIEFHLPKDQGSPKFELLGKPLESANSDRTIERLASPLILRPIVCEGGKAMGLGIILNTKQIPPNGLYLKGKASNDPQPEAELQGDEPDRIEPLRKRANVLDAFLEDLK